jgi:hypothetical protein
MGSGDSAVAVLAGKFAEIGPHLGERAWRLYLGSEARAYAAGQGCGLAAAVAVVAAAAGVSRATVAAGAGELAEGAEPMPGRARRAGAGRKKLEGTDPGLRPALTELVEAATRGDCGSPRVDASSSSRNAGINRGSCSSSFLRPPPGRRTRPGPASSPTPAPPRHPPPSATRPGRPRDRGNPAVPGSSCHRPQHQPPRPLIQPRQQELKLRPHTPEKIRVRAHQHILTRHAANSG